MAEGQYRVGEILRVRLSNSLYDRDFTMADLRRGKNEPSLPFVGTAYNLAMNIEHVFQPSTLAAVMVVRFQDPVQQRDRKAILKLFDRRFMPNAREDEQAPAWSADAEQDYAALVKSGDAKTYLRRWRAEEEREDFPEEDAGQILQEQVKPEADMRHAAKPKHVSIHRPEDVAKPSNNLSSGGKSQTIRSNHREIKDLKVTDEISSCKKTPAEIECKIQYLALKLFECETKVYRLLSHLQGNCIPKLLGLSLALPALHTNTSRVEETRRCRDSDIAFSDQTWGGGIVGGSSHSRWRSKTATGNGTCVLDKLRQRTQTGC